MTAQSVEAVWFWRFTTAPFKATYGRLPGTTYSKDFLQVSGECSAAFDDVYARARHQEIPLTFKWPGGSRTGKLFEATDYPQNRRLELRWETDNAPAPWKLYRDDDTNPLKTFPGEPGYRTEAEADREYKDLVSRDLGPWLVVVKLFDEDDILHVRAYLERPSDDLAYASISHVPERIRREMARVPAKGGCGVVRLGGRPVVMRAQRIVSQVLSALERGPNVLLVGPPGTGKTVALEDLRALFEAGSVDSLFFDPDRVHDAWAEPPDATPQGPVRTVVFHPSYSYEEFVLGLVPKPVAGGGVEVEPRPGPLLSLAHWALEPGHAALLIVDEFNRGNAAGIFGDTLALLDRDKRHDPERNQVGAEVDRPYSGMAVEVAPELETATAGREVPDRIRLPASLWIVAALNSSDRSVAPIDAALRRRFSILRVEPDDEVLAQRFGVPVPDAWTGADDPTQWDVQTVQALAIHLIRSLNERIELILGADFLLGHAVVWNVGGADVEAAVRSLAAAFDEFIVSTLRMTFADQDEPLAAILRAGPPPAGVVEPGAAERIAHWIVPTGGLELVAPPRLRVRSCSDMPWQDAARALAALV